MQHAEMSWGKIRVLKLQPAGKTGSAGVACVASATLSAPEVGDLVRRMRRKGVQEEEVLPARRVMTATVVGSEVRPNSWTQTPEGFGCTATNACMTTALFRWFVPEYFQ